MCRGHSASNSSSLCAAVWLELRFLCPVAVQVWPKSLSSSRRFLCPVAVRLKLLSLSGLSSAELVSLAIPIERATPQSGALNSSQCSKGQCTMGLCDRTCIRCAYIYIHIPTKSRPQLLASLRSLCLTLSN